MKDIIIKDEKTAVARKAQSAIIVMMLFNILIMIFILTPLPNTSGQSIDSRVEPAIVLGSDLGDFLGTSVDEIWVYAFVGGIWRQIPFQIDERNDGNGSYFVNAEDGILDNNDEIVFMPFDAGEAIHATTWVKDTEDKRYEVAVTDPIDASMKYAYIYRSSSLTKTFTKDYVNYNPTSHVISASDYTIGFDDTRMGIMDELRINTSLGGDNTDILDRMKYRLQITIGIPFLFDEDDFDYTMVGYKDGPVRLIQQIGSGDFVNINYAYKSYAMATQKMNIGISPDWVRISLDYLDSATPMTYYDSNANVLTIDGVTDTPTSTTAPTWAEITGPHGTVVIPRDLTQVGGNPSLYYSDDFTSNDAPESEFGEYGDSGIYIANPPTGNPTTYLSFYFLPPNLGNVGSTYDAYTSNPLSINTQAQFMDSSPPPDITDVSVFPDPQNVNDYVNISAIIEDNYELYGAWIDITDPNDNHVGNFSMNYNPITCRYYDNRTYDIVGMYEFTIWANDTSNNWNSSFGQFVIQDTIRPDISDAQADPDPQKVNDNVNISAIIVDNYELYGACVDITDPNDNPTGNFSMNYDLNNNRYYFEQVYDIVGTYQFTIWANDTSNNWKSTFGQFLMHDTTFPDIFDTTALPNPQEVDGFVNISANIVDNYELKEVWINITDPKDNPLGNYSMSYDPGTNRYYLSIVYDIVGTYQFTIWANDTSNNWNLSFGQFVMQDTTLSVITDVKADPDPQEVEGFVNISAKIVDNYEIFGAWVDIKNPNNNPTGNFSMSYDSDTNRFYLKQAYDIVGTYQFIIWARDTSYNWNSSFGQFEILDTTLPEIFDVTAYPNPQEVEGLVDISAVVEDNHELYEVWINITDPNDNLVGNFSMIFDMNRYHNEQAYDIVGMYQFIIWASDTSFNWILFLGQFQIQDTTPPVISDARADPDPQEVDGYVNISAFVTDNVDVDRVRVKVTDPNDNLVGNFSMRYDPLADRYYNNRVYDIVGTYQFTIWASDTSNNWKSKSDHFTIQDTQPPIAHAGLNQEVIVGTMVIFDGSASTDNVGIVDYTWTFTDGKLQTLHGSSPNYKFNNVDDFKITLRVTDATDNWDTDTFWVNVTSVPDTTSPTITHTPITSIKIGKPLLISAIITDNIEVTYASLFYRQRGDSIYTEVAMTNTFNDEWEAEILSSVITTAGIEYYIFATDGVNDAMQPEGDSYVVNVEGEEEGGANTLWLLLLIILIAVIFLVIILFFLVKNKNEKRG